MTGVLVILMKWTMLTIIKGPLRHMSAIIRSPTVFILREIFLVSCGNEDGLVTSAAPGVVRLSLKFLVSILIALTAIVLI